MSVDVRFDLEILLNMTLTLKIDTSVQFSRGFLFCLVTFHLHHVIAVNRVMPSSMVIYYVVYLSVCQFSLTLTNESHLGYPKVFAQLTS